VARKYGLPMKGITLFIFGGVAEMSEEPPSARVEFMMAIAGPISSFILGFIFFVLFSIGKVDAWPPPINGILGYLFFINFLLAIFNLIPAFPLDGGRVLRSILWGAKKDLRWATRISSNIGIFFGILLIVVGFLNVLTGDFISGMWWALIGMFLHGAARASYQQLLTRRALEGEPVRRFMKPDPISVSPSITVEELVEDYIYKYHHKMFPILESGRLAGCITSKQVKEIGKDEWATKRVGELATRCTAQNTIGPDEDAVKAISRMKQSGASRLMVVENGRLLGIIALKDLLDFLSLKIELEE
jgi:Zn-dependent protease/CBS domain-containing protein